MMFLLVLSGCMFNPPIQSENDIAGQSQSVSMTENLNLSSLYPSLPADEIVIGFSQLGSESDWRKANTASIVDAANEAGVTLLMENAEQSQEAQFAAIRSFIEAKVDVIAIAPVVQTGWEDILLEIKEAAIPAVIIDRSVNVDDTSLYVTFIGSDFYEEGMKAGKYALDKMRNSAGHIRIVELAGTVGSTPSIDRGRGFRDAISKRADLEVVASLPADFTQEQGRYVMEQILIDSKQSLPHILFAHNDDMAIGAIEAIEDYGLKPGKDIIIISVDGTKQAFEMMLEGKINAVVECNPLLGPLLMQAAREIMAGRTIPKRIIPPEDIFTPEYAAIEVHNRLY